MRPVHRAATLLAALLTLCSSPSQARTGVHNPVDKLVFYGLRMDPAGIDASNFSRKGFGGGIEAVLPLPHTYRLVAATVGLEAVNLLSQTHKFRDPGTGLKMEQHTTQNYVRLFAGGQLGSHSSGLLRPYAGANVAAVWYGIGSEIVIPDDYDHEKDIHQQLSSDGHVVFGWDGSAGLDFNFVDRWGIDLGVRYLHSYAVPQQLGHGAVTIAPGYLQYRVGISIGRRTLES
jgi:opacity protein-like surface antigen